MELDGLRELKTWIGLQALFQMAQRTALSQGVIVHRAPFLKMGTPVITTALGVIHLHQERIACGLPVGPAPSNAGQLNGLRRG